uniref:Uncharacterized protein n=1 Tax=Leersia perrieri TaxID=77586 RepID=A0A0D9X9G2_9ORYZ
MARVDLGLCRALTGVGKDGLLTSTEKASPSSSSSYSTTWTSTFRLAETMYGRRRPPPGGKNARPVRVVLPPTSNDQTGLLMCSVALATEMASASLPPGSRRSLAVRLAVAGSQITSKPGWREQLGVVPNGYGTSMSPHLLGHPGNAISPADAVVIEVFIAARRRRRRRRSATIRIAAPSTLLPVGKTIVRTYSVLGTPTLLNERGLSRQPI